MNPSTRTGKASAFTKGTVRLGLRVKEWDQDQYFLPAFILMLSSVTEQQDQKRTRSFSVFMTKESAFKELQFYYQAITEWETKTHGDLEDELKILMGCGYLTIQQRAIIGVAKAIVERIPNDAPIGSLALTEKFKP